MLNTKYFKILNKDRNHNGFQYKIGLNVLPQGEFARTGSCVPGGFYYTTIENILEFIDYGIDLFEVTIPEDAQIRKISNKWRTDKIILGNHYSLFDISTYVMLKEKGINIDVCTDFAAKHGLIPLFNFLIKSIDNPIYNDAFYKAIKHGQLLFIEAIIDKVTDYFNYAMILACEHGHLSIVKLLVEKNPDHDYKYHSTKAIENNHLDVVKYLVEKYPKSYHFNLILNIAAQYDRQDIFKYIATELSIKSNYQLIILLASEKGYLDIIQQFRDLVDSCDFIICAFMATANGHLHVLKYFVDSNINIIDIINNKKYCVFGSIFYSHNNNDIIKYLIENTVNKVNHLKTYTKCIIKSANVCNTEIFELILNILIKDGANINHIFSGRYYKLMNCISILELAICHGFQPNIKDLSIALKKAISKYDLTLVEYLIKLGASHELSPGDFTNACCKNENLPMVKLLAENCIILEKNKYEFICIAAQHNHMNIVNYLVKKFSLPSNVYTKLLRECIKLSNLDIIKLFVDLGANIDTESIVKAIKCGHLDVIEYFVERGITISRDLIGYADNNGYDNIAEYLRKKLIL